MKRLISLQDAARMLDCSTRAVAYLLRVGQLAGVKTDPKRQFVSLLSVKRLAAERERSST